MLLLRLDPRCGPWIQSVAGDVMVAAFSVAILNVRVELCSVTSFSTTVTFITKYNMQCCSCSHGVIRCSDAASSSSQRDILHFDRDWKRRLKLVTSFGRDYSTVEPLITHTQNYLYFNTPGHGFFAMEHGMGYWLSQAYRSYFVNHCLPSWCNQSYGI